MDADIPELRLNAVTVAARLLDDHDADRDAQLTIAELAAAPAVRHSIAIYDADRDGRLSQAEIAQGVECWRDANVKLLPFSCTVTLDGRPLAGAIVRLEPVSALADVVRSASGTSNSEGAVFPALDPTDGSSGRRIPGLAPPGWYDVRITHPRKTLPRRYNSKSTLGVEISPLVAQSAPVFELTTTPEGR